MDPVRLLPAGCLISPRILNMEQMHSSRIRIRVRPGSIWGENDASSIKSKPQHISYPLDSSGARRRPLAAVSASRNGRRIKLHLKRKLQKKDENTKTLRRMEGKINWPAKREKMKIMKLMWRSQERSKR